MKKYKIICIAFAVICSFIFISASGNSAPKIDKEAMLERHNYYREMVGVPPLEWSDKIAFSAQVWADHLAKNCDLKHDPKTRLGENIYWTSGTASATDAVDNWGEEKKFYNHRRTTYKRGASATKTGHYSQMIWKATTRVGGAMQKCKHGGEIWVCRYGPAGNVIGEKAF